MPFWLVWLWNIKRISRSCCGNFITRVQKTLFNHPSHHLYYCVMLIIAHLDQTKSYYTAIQYRCQYLVLLLNSVQKSSPTLNKSLKGLSQSEEFLHIFPPTDITAGDFRFPSSVRQVTEPTFPPESSFQQEPSSLSFSRHPSPPPPCV